MAYAHGEMQSKIDMKGTLKCEHHKKGLCDELTYYKKESEYFSVLS